MPLISISSIRQAGEEFQKVRGGNFLGFAKPQIRHPCLSRRTKESLFGLPIQEQLYQDSEEAESLLLVQRTA